MSHDPDNANPAEDPSTPEEELVAYLDGELDDETSRRIEQQLAADPKLRDALAQLERTWDMLDRLDRAQADDTFTRTTMEMVAVAAEADVQRQQEEAPQRQRRRWLIGSGGLTAAALAGFLAVWLFWPNPNEQLLQDLPVLENLDEYRQIDDIKFLQMLYQEDLFAMENGDGA